MPDRLRNFIEENFRIRQDEMVVDAAIRLLRRLKRLAPDRETIQTTTVEKGEFGRTRQVYETRYEDTGELIRRRVEVLTYYDTGELNLLKRRVFDGKGDLMKEREVKHFLNGRKPVVKILKE